MRKNYETPSIEVVVFDSKEDIITTSPNSTESLVPYEDIPNANA